MINTERVVGFYTDVFGNEIDEYEQIERYTVNYKGFIFEGDTDGWNELNTDRWDEAYEFYNAYANDMEVYIRDNEYGMTFSYGDWN